MTNSADSFKYALLVQVPIQGPGDHTAQQVQSIIEAVDSTFKANNDAKVNISIKESDSSALGNTGDESVAQKRAKQAAKDKGQGTQSENAA